MISVCDGWRQEEDIKGQPQLADRFYFLIGRKCNSWAHAVSQGILLDRYNMGELLSSRWWISLQNKSHHILKITAQIVAALEFSDFESYDSKWTRTREYSMGVIILSIIYP